MAGAKLRLVKTIAGSFAPVSVPVSVEPSGDAIRLERRDATRHTLSGRATAVNHASTREGGVNRIRSLELLNISDTGLAAVCQDPLDLDSDIAVFFPPHGPERGFDLYGRIVRCVKRGYGHEIGIRFDPKPAA